jgi:HK97 family phage prohead protease
MRSDLEFDTIMKSLKEGTLLNKRLETAVKSYDDEKRVISFIFSTPNKDRKGDTINNKGWEVEDFNKNPVFLWQHDMTEQPLGLISGLEVDEDGNLVGDVEFWKSNRDPVFWSDFDRKADSIYEQYKKGFLKGASVRFKPLDFNPSTKNKNGIDYTSQYLLEISAVSIPDNADALSLEVIKVEEKEVNQTEDFAKAIANLINIK